MGERQEREVRWRTAIQGQKEPKRAGEETGIAIKPRAV